MKRIDAVQLDALLQGAKTIEEDGLGIKVARLGAVSYTHLTLPTMCSV